jgi:hypothetical protein
VCKLKRTFDDRSLGVDARFFRYKSAKGSNKHTNVKAEVSLLW